MFAVQHDLQRALAAAAAALLDALRNQKGSIRSAQFDYRRGLLLFKPLCTATAAGMKDRNGPHSCGTAL